VICVQKCRLIRLVSVEQVAQSPPASSWCLTADDEGPPPTHCSSQCQPASGIHTVHSTVLYDAVQQHRSQYSSVQPD